MKNKKIMIADDDQEIVEALTARCASLGLKVYQAFDSLSALVMIHHCRPDLICLDLNMPNGNGIGICEMLAADPDLCSIPIIVLTGKNDAEIVRRCHSLCAYYVPKRADVWSRLGPLVQELTA